jgi:hypothetical protein
MYGAFMNEESIEPQLLKPSPLRFRLSVIVEAGFSADEIMDVSCGLLTTDLIAFPTLVIERQSDHGSLFVGQNQMLASLTCVVEAQRVACKVLGEDLGALALGLLNYGKYVEFWIGFEASDVPPRSYHDSIL